jgi:hypothetical protein
VLCYHIGPSVLGFDPGLTRVEWMKRHPTLDCLVEGMYRRGSGVGGGGMVSLHTGASVHGNQPRCKVHARTGATETREVFRRCR